MERVQRCTVHKERNLLAHAPKALHDEVKADYTDMMYAENAEQVRKKRKAFLAKWRLRCRGVADSLEEAGERLFTFLRYPGNGSPCDHQRERLHGEFKRRVKTQCACGNGGHAVLGLMAFAWWLANTRKKPIDLAAWSNHRDRELRQKPIGHDPETGPVLKLIRFPLENSHWQDAGLWVNAKELAQELTEQINAAVEESWSYCQKLCMG